MLWQFLCVYHQFTIDLHSIWIKAPDGFHVVSILKKSGTCSLYLHLVLVWRLLWWSFHAGSMENWCRFHAGSMCVLKVLPLSTFVGFTMHSDWCRFHGGSMEVPCRFHAGSRELSWRLHTSKLNQQTQHVTNMNLHGTARKLHETCISQSTG